ncbi:hypothetical protein LJR186_001235 [Microbacterium foliorum]
MEWIDFSAEIQGVEFSGRRFDYKPGFYIQSVEGLTAGAAVASSAVARTRGPGALYTPGRRSDERAITFRGFAWGGTQHGLQELNEQMSSILTEEDEFTELDFQELGEWRWVTVGRAGRWVFDRRKRTGFADYQITFRAPDQRIYGAKLQTTGWGQSVTVVNRGPYPAPVMLAVRGASAGGYTVDGPRSTRVIVTRALAAGVQHQYDGDTGILSVAGVPQTTGVARSDRLEVPFGEHTFSVSAGAEISVSGATTYVP